MSDEAIAQLFEGWYGVSLDLAKPNLC